MPPIRGFLILIYPEFGMNDHCFLAVECKKELPPAAAQHSPSPAASGKGSSHTSPTRATSPSEQERDKFPEGTLPANPHTKLLCPPGLQLRGCVHLTITSDCSPSMEHTNRSIVQKPVDSWMVKQEWCPAHTGQGEACIPSCRVWAFWSLMHTMSTPPPYPQFCLCSNNLTCSE